MHVLRCCGSASATTASGRASARTTGYQNASASTADFRRVMEEASGDDLAAFFEQWLYRGGVPRLTGTWSWDRAEGTATVELRQVQPGAPFRIPVEVAVQAPGAASVERIEMTSAVATATFKVPQEPTALVLDPNVRLLAATEIARK